jgi:peptidoglycan/xylan/chitin deacetylase (PgdA/CDA1 family)
MMRDIAGSGWEIGLHGSYLSPFDAALLRDQRLQLESVTGARVSSIRQHYLQYDPRSTPANQSAAGLHCDSTQGFNFSSGFRTEAAFPYWGWDHRAEAALPVLELPLHVMDSALFGSAGLRYDRPAAEAHVVAMVEAVASVGGCLVVNWHPNYIELPEYVETYATLLRYAAERGAWGCSCAQVYAAWTAWESALGLPPIPGRG